MSEQRWFVTVDIRSPQGNMAHADQFRARHPEAAMAPLRDGSGISFCLHVFTNSEDTARRRVLAWAQEVFASPRYRVEIRKVERG